MVSADEFGLLGRNHYAHDRNPPYWRAIEGAVDALVMRRSVAERLARVDSRLKSAGFRLFLFDAWRPDAVQVYFHDVWMPERLRRTHPGLEGEALWTEVERYWSAPTVDPAAPAPHRTGGAVDLTVVDALGAQLFMGSVFDDPSPLAHTDRFEHEHESDLQSFSADEARANRRMLHTLMREAGFAPHPDEWWHYSFGDQMWAAATGASAAFYGPADWVHAR